jgi:transcriptional regulator with XRE-family HTH domain
MDAKSLGPIIRKWRIEAGFTQEELGQRAGLAKKIVGSIERGERTPERWDIVKLSHALGRPPDDLVTLWYRSYLNEISALGKLQDSRAPQPEEKGSLTSSDSESRVDQIIDQIAALSKELYRESRNDFREMFLDWLPPSGLSSSPPQRARKRVGRKRGSTKA